jgi:hypothetical protein
VITGEIHCPATSKNKMIETARHSVIICSCFLLLTAFAVTGCGGKGEEAQPLPAQSPPPAPAFIRLTQSPPPEPMPEIEPMISDFQHETWRPGFWSYDGGQFTWISGAVVAKPAFTAVWLPDHWEKREYGLAVIPKKRKLRKRNGIAVALRLFKPKIVKPRKGRKSYRRKPKHPSEVE